MEIYLFNVVLFLALIFVINIINIINIENFILLYVINWVFISLNVSLIFGYYISIISLFVPILFCLVFISPFYIVRFFLNDNIRSVSYSTVYNNKILSKYITVINIIGIVGIMSQINQFGFGLSISEIAIMTSEARYANENVNKIQILANGFIFALFFIYGFMGVEIKNHKKGLFLSILIILMISIVTSSKAALIMCIAFYITGLILINVFSKSIINLKHKIKLIIYFLLSLIIILLVSIIIQIFRYGTNLDISTIIYNSDKIFIYAFGQFSAFGVWFDNNINYIDNITYGNGLFTGIYSLIFGHQRVAGYYDTFTYIAVDKYTNVFTLSRFIIQDFTMLGAFLFLFFCGFISSIIKFFFSRYVNFLIIYFSVLLVEVIFGFSTSILSYNVVLFSFLIIYVFFINSIKVSKDLN
ncbi:oligosaccharide repeat unit polymerase [Photobacterium phosphoreum]|uniref:Oligosaccharide repeat unit polymerase n=1 Tax=Photobacterium phosphoreum TaxID=659 RepID=A0AAW4ZU84_PHOPO|nr:O-antigen polymerase [Photobacterium phosphoreum]MCD9490696.1 oligosaccharide repeat unit polymerase [Photobacterium phosphoreum]MCF2189962.1 oligosaccharide repeat unit polymerase [Photobacterium phosphoreum]MCF2300829.1 oligosaccharide repeat unit polymerase [Photobacterium phosphoreum]